MKKSPRTTLPFAAVTSIAAAAVAAAHRATAERAPQAPKRRGRPLNAKPFQTAGRSSWFAHPTLPNGTRPSKSFESEEAAAAWIADRYESATKAQQPALGGPDVATVAQALYKYAFQFTVVKGGAEAELTRIDNDLRGGGCRQDRARAARTLLIGCRSDHWTARSSRTLPLRA